MVILRVRTKMVQKRKRNRLNRTISLTSALESSPSLSALSTQNARTAKDYRRQASRASYLWQQNNWKRNANNAMYVVSTAMLVVLFAIAITPSRSAWVTQKVYVEQASSPRPLINLFDSVVTVKYRARRSNTALNLSCWKRHCSIWKKLWKIANNLSTVRYKQPLFGIHCHPEILIKKDLADQVLIMANYAHNTLFPCHNNDGTINLPSFLAYEVMLQLGLLFMINLGTLQ